MQFLRGGPRRERNGGRLLQPSQEAFAALQVRHLPGHNVARSFGPWLSQRRGTKAAPANRSSHTQLGGVRHIGGVRGNRGGERWCFARQQRASLRQEDTEAENCPSTEDKGLLQVRTRIVSIPRFLPSHGKDMLELWQGQSLQSGLPIEPASSASSVRISSARRGGANTQHAISGANAFERPCVHPGNRHRRWCNSHLV